MRRAIPAFVITAIAVIALASFHSSAPASGKLATRTPGSTAPAATAPPPTSGSSETPATSPPSAPATTAPPPAGSTETKTYDGQAVDNQYGTVQVRITVQGKKITNVEALQLPSDRERSAYISEQAGPMLQQEALQAQSANIDIVSGATYTSESYAQSLQSALDKAHI